MNVAVTGGSGFIGRKLVEALVQRGHSVKVLSRTDFPRGPKVRLVPGDLTSTISPIGELLEDCGVIFHCAGEFNDPAKMESLHVGGTRRLLQGAAEEARRTGFAIHWVQLSSVGAYGFPGEYVARDRVVTEETPPEPIGVYEVTKTQSDEMVAAAGKTHALTYSIVRPSKVIGAGMPGDYMRTLGTAIRQGRFFYVGPPGAVATYVDVEDVVEVLMLCGFDARAHGKTFNISNDCPLEEMIGSIATAVGVRPPRLRLPTPVVRTAVNVLSRVVRLPLSQKQIDGLIRRTRYPYRQLEATLGFVPRKSVPETVREALVGGGAPPRATERRA